MLRLIALMLFSAAALAQSPVPRVASLGWLAGTWVSEGEGKVTEAWIGPGNGLMVAVNLSTFAKGRTMFEFLRIADTAEGFSYFASPAGRPPVEFRLKELGDQRVVFENAAHDFPQRILYRRDGDTLLARIEGTLGGIPRHKEWRFARAREQPR